MKAKWKFNKLNVGFLIHKLRQSVGSTCFHNFVVSNEYSSLKRGDV